MSIAGRIFTVLSGAVVTFIGGALLVAPDPASIVAGALCIGYGARVAINYAERQ